MANFDGTVACNGIKLKPGVEDYLKEFHITAEDINVGVDADGIFSFYGYDWPNIYSSDKEDNDDDISDCFFEGLRKFVPEGEKLVIQMVGGVKCCFPLSANEITITSKTVTYLGFKN